MKLIIRREADQEISRAAAWYEQRQNGLGIHFAGELEQTFQRIRDNPELYPALYRSIRKATLRTFPYSIYYLPSGQRVIVLRVLHQRRREPTW